MPVEQDFHDEVSCAKEQWQSRRARVGVAASEEVLEREKWQVRGAALQTKGPENQVREHVQLRFRGNASNTRKDDETFVQVDACLGRTGGHYRIIGCML